MEGGKLSQWREGRKKKAREDVVCPPFSLHGTSPDTPQTSETHPYAEISAQTPYAAAETKTERERDEKRRRRNRRWAPWIERMMGISAAT